MKFKVNYVITMFIFSGILFAQTKWKVDRSHTNVNFSVSHMVISEVTGTFKDIEATIETAKDDFSDAKINVAIKAKSVDTGNNGRDNHLRGVDFFNTDVDSIITFTSSKVEKSGDNTYKIHGSLTMRGVTKDVVLDTKFRGKIKGGRGMVAAFKATTTINRKDWGLNWNRTIEAGGLVVGEEVELTILAEFNETKS